MHPEATFQPQYQRVRSSDRSPHWYGAMMMPWYFSATRGQSIVQLRRYRGWPTSPSSTYSSLNASMSWVDDRCRVFASTASVTTNLLVIRSRAYSSDLHHDGQSSSPSTETQSPR